MVPCAQGRIIVETARPAPPHFATCSGYRRRPMLLGANGVAVPRNPGVPGAPQSPAARPEDLGVTPWFADEAPLPTTPASGLDPHPNSHLLRCFYGDGDLRPDLSSTRNSSVEGEAPRALGAQRKAYMDLRDAIALLDETCPNPDASEPSPRTPRTPVTLHPKSKRARSKSSDNSSNYSNERLSEKSADSNQHGAGRNQEREKKRPFLRKIGISKTEDRPFLSKLAPRIIGKPYLEKIGPSKAVERPFLDKIGPSNTVEKFTFNVTPRVANPPDAGDRRAFVETRAPRLVPREARISFRKRSGKGQLQKMYSFETEDLNSFKGALSPVKSPRDPLRGASLDDVLESGPSSLPPLDVVDQQQQQQQQQQRQRQREATEPESQSVAELVKCRIMSSEEIISSSSCLCSPQEAVSWGNSPRRKNGSSKPPSTNSPVKRQISWTDSPEPRSKELAVLRPGEKSPTKSRMSSVGSKFGSWTLPKLQRDESESSRRRQTSEDVLDRMDESEGRGNRAGGQQTRGDNDRGSFERRGISSDNLKLSREIFITASSVSGVGRSRREMLTDCWTKERQDMSREAFKRLHGKFETRNVASNEETNDPCPSSRLQTSRLHLEQNSSSNDESGDRDEAVEKNAAEGEVRAGSPSAERDDSPVSPSMKTVRSALRKQKSIDQTLEMQESGDAARSLRKPKRRIFHEPSQETMDLLTELLKVKSLLKTPSVEELDKPEDFAPLKCPKRISLADREFCLSIDRENSIRRAPSGVATNERSSEDWENGKEEEEEEKGVGEGGREFGSLPGPALFEKRGLSLDYADAEIPVKPETRAISLASARSPPSETEETNSLDFGFICDSKSYCSDVFNTPTPDEMIDQKIDNLLTKEKLSSSPKDPDDHARDDEGRRNHCAEVDIAIPIDQKNSPKRRVQIQGRTSDLYEIISPRSTPFRVKQRLSKISVEDTMTQESFTLSKVDCKSVAVQKRNRCFPL